MTPRPFEKNDMPPPRCMSTQPCSSELCVDNRLRATVAERDDLRARLEELRKEINSVLCQWQDATRAERGERDRTVKAMERTAEAAAALVRTPPLSEGEDGFNLEDLADAIESIDLPKLLETVELSPSISVEDARSLLVKMRHEVASAAAREVQSLLGTEAFGGRAQLVFEAAMACPAAEEMLKKVES